MEEAPLNLLSVTEESSAKSVHFLPDLQKRNGLKKFFSKLKRAKCMLIKCYLSNLADK